MSKSIDTSKYSSADSLSDLLAIFANVDSSSWAAKKGKQYTATELGDYYYDYLSTQDERAYNEYYYNTYESPSAMVAQYQEAGLNPALMYGSGASTTSSNNSTGYSNPNQGQSAQSDNFTRLTEVMQMLMSGASLGSQISVNSSQAEQSKAAAEKSRVEAESAAYDLEKKREADSTPNPETGDTRSSAQIDKDIKMWESHAAEANAIKAYNDAAMSKQQRDWLQELYDAGVNLSLLDAQDKEYDIALKHYQADLNEYMRSNGYYGYKLKQVIAETTRAQGAATQIEFDTEWLVDAPKWLKPVIGCLSAILSKL